MDSKWDDDRLETEGGKKKDDTNCLEKQDKTHEMISRKYMPVFVQCNFSMHFHSLLLCPKNCYRSPQSVSWSLWHWGSWRGQHAGSTTVVGRIDGCYVLENHNTYFKTYSSFVIKWLFQHSLLFMPLSTNRTACKYVCVYVELL